MAELAYTTLRKSTLHFFKTDLCRANRFLAVHPAPRRNQVQTVAEPDGQITKKDRLLYGLFATVDAVSIDVSLSVLILGFFPITYPFYAHCILPIQKHKVDDVRNDVQLLKFSLGCQ